MKIYTKKGDKGTTSLFGGKKLKKDDVRIEAYGTVDELNAFLGLLMEKMTDIKDQYEILRMVQFELFDIGAQLATDPDKREKFNLPFPNESDIVLLEDNMDEMNISLKPLKAFILPGGNEVAAICHVARTICRRAERRMVTLYDENTAKGDPITILIKYMNRLSDYLFVLSRYICMKSDVEEIIWISDRKKS